MKHLIPFSIILLFLSACDLNTNLDLSKVKDPESDIYKIYEGIEIESIYKEDLYYDGNMDISISGYAYNGDWLEAYFIHNGDLANTYTHFTSDAYWDSYEDYEENYSSIEAYYAEMELNSKVEDITYEDITGDGIDDAIVITNYSLDDYQSIDLTFFIGKDDGYSYYSLAEMHHPEVYDDFSAFKAVVTKDEYFTVELGGDDPYWDRFITFRYDDELGDVLLHKDGGTIIGDDGQLVREEVLGSDDFGMVYLEAFTPNGAEFFSLKREVNQLNEVTINAIVPIKIKQDTVAFNAKAFKVKQDDNVEDLIKKLPGVQIDTDGTVNAQGEDVQKILVDGKEFFSNDMSIALKNLNADAIKSVQIIDEESDETRTTGVKDGEKTKIINLVLKEGKKSGYFGKAGAGIGTNDRYQTNFDLNRFTKNSQLALFGKLKNINNFIHENYLYWFVKSSLFNAIKISNKIRA